MGVYGKAISRAINSAEFDYDIATQNDCTYWMQATFEAAYGAFCKRHFAAEARRLAHACMSAAVAAERHDQTVVSARLDARIQGMIADLSRGALSDLLGLSPEIERSHSAVMSEVQAGFDAGTISPAMIAAAWQEDRI